MLLHVIYVYEIYILNGLLIWISKFYL